MKASEFDRLFDEGGDISHLVDWKSGRRPFRDAKAFSVELPAHMVDSLDREAARRGISRDALLRLFISSNLGPAAE